MKLDNRDDNYNWFSCIYIDTKINLNIKIG